MESRIGRNGDLPGLIRHFFAEIFVAAGVVMSGRIYAPNNGCFLSIEKFFIFNYGGDRRTISHPSTDVEVTFYENELKVKVTN